MTANCFPDRDNVAVDSEKLTKRIEKWGIWGASVLGLRLPTVPSTGALTTVRDNASFHSSTEACACSTRARASSASASADIA